MQAATLRRTVTRDHAGLLERTLQVLEEAGIRYCVINDQAVNAYAEPVVSLDLDLVLAPGEVERLGPLFGPPIRIEHFEHSVTCRLRARTCGSNCKPHPELRRLVPQSILERLLE